MEPLCKVDMATDQIHMEDRNHDVAVLEQSQTRNIYNAEKSQQNTIVHVVSVLSRITSQQL